jgi:hypothetical protein
MGGLHNGRILHHVGMDIIDASIIQSPDGIDGGVEGTVLVNSIN